MHTLNFSIENKLTWTLCHCTSSFLARSWLAHTFFCYIMLCSMTQRHDFDLKLAYLKSTHRELSNEALNIRIRWPWLPPLNLNWTNFHFHTKLLFTVDDFPLGTLFLFRYLQATTTTRVQSANNLHRHQSIFVKIPFCAIVNLSHSGSFDYHCQWNCDTVMSFNRRQLYSEPPFLCFQLG